MEIKEVKSSRILNPTSINLGEYVINPYKGCQLHCLYCYAQFTKTCSKDFRKWGEYVDIRVNACELLRKELKTKKPKTVLLGSTTECFQPLELEYRISQNILQILNENKIYYSILTRSPLILEYLSLLSQGFCKEIYFTINEYPMELKKLLEPQSASFQARQEAILRLKKKGIPVIAYFSPILPKISNISGVFEQYKAIDRIEFEGLNFNLGNINQLIEAIGLIYPDLKPWYQQLLNDTILYQNTWREIKEGIKEEAKKLRKTCQVYIHSRHAYFKNKYT